MSDPLLATGQCRTEMHPLCPGGLCTCTCHQPAQPAGERLEGGPGSPGDLPTVAEAPGGAQGPCLVCTCATCGGTIERPEESTAWRHIGQRIWDHGAVPIEHAPRGHEPVDSTRWPGFFQRVVARRLEVPMTEGVGTQLPPGWTINLTRATAPLAEEVGRIVVDQLLELAETLSETAPEVFSPAIEETVDRARLIDPVYTEQRWDETKEARR